MRVVKKGKVNWPVAVILAAGTILLGMGVILGHRWRSRVMARNALAAGQRYYEQKDWPNASSHFKVYLAKVPDNVEVLARYARAQMAIRPLKSENILSAIGTYRRLIRLTPHDPVPYQKLAALYENIDNYTELRYIARRRLSFAPDDRQASLWLAKAEIYLHKPREARELLVTLVRDLPDSPEGCVEFCQSCLFLSGLDSRADDEETRQNAVRWLNRAVERYPDRPEPYLNRARFKYRMTGEDFEARQSGLQSARDDLQRAQKLNPNPRLRLEICHEWLDHGLLEHAAQQLKCLEQIDEQVINESFTDQGDFRVAKYLLAAELAARKGATDEGAVLSDDILKKVMADERRLVVLPVAIKLYAATKQTRKARLCLNEYRDILRVHRNVPEAVEKVLLLQAIVDWADGCPYRLIDCLEPAVGRKPNNPQMLALLVDAYIQTRQPWRAIQAMKQYLGVVPDDDAMAHRLVQLYCGAQKWKEAAVVVDRLCSRHPDDDALQLLQVQVATQLLSSRPHQQNGQQIEQLKTRLARLRETNPDNMAIPILQARLALKQNAPEQAQSILETAASEHADSIDVEMELIKLQKQSGQLARAIERCRALCSRHKGQATLWLLLADCQSESRFYPEAEKTLAEGAELIADAEGRRLLMRQRAILNLRYGRRQKGIDQLRALADNDTQDFRSREVLLTLPEIFRNQTIVKQLIGEMREIEGENGFRWRIGRITVWLSGRDWRQHSDQITTDLNRCIKAVPDWSTPLLLLGEFHEKQGELAAAETLYRQALAQNPEMLDVADRLLAILEKQHKFASARGLLDQLELAPGDRYHRQALIAMKAGNLSQAIDELKGEIDHHPRAVDAYVRLARLVYLQTGDVTAGLDVLDRADQKAVTSHSLLAVRCALLRAANRETEAIDILNRAVQLHATFEMMLLRATFFNAIGRTGSAEADYRRLTTFDRQGLGYELLGKFYADNHRSDDALAAWEEGVDKYPDNMALKNHWMNALLRRGREEDNKRVADLLDHLALRYPGDPHLLQVRVMILLDQKTPEADRAAEVILRQVIEINPDEVNAHLKLIALMMKRGEYAAARDLAIQAQADNPDNHQLLLARARAEYLIGNYPFVAELAHLILLDEPANVDALEILVKAAVKTNRDQTLEEAGVLVKRALARNADKEQLHLARAQILRSLGRIDEAIDLLEAHKKTTDGPPTLPLLLTLTELYRLQGDIDSADVLLRVAEQRVPHASAVVQQRLYLLAVQRQYETIGKRVAGDRAGAECDPGTVILAASLLAESGEHTYQNHAVGLLENLLSRYPEITDARRRLAWLMFQQEKYDRAEQVYRELLEADPEEPNVLNNLAWILANVRHDYPNALALINRGIDLAPDMIDLRDTRAQILVSIGRLRDARMDYETYLNRLPRYSVSFAETAFKLGELCVRLKDKLQARHYFQQALDADRDVGYFSADQRRVLETQLKQLPESNIRIFP